MNTNPITAAPISKEEADVRERAFKDWLNLKADPQERNRYEFYLEGDIKMEKERVEAGGIPSSNPPAYGFTYFSDQAWQTAQARQKFMSEEATRKVEAHPVEPASPPLQPASVQADLHVEPEGLKASLMSIAKKLMTKAGASHGKNSVTSPNAPSSTNKL
jgi:hypothetical protein